MNKTNRWREAGNLILAGLGMFLGVVGLLIWATWQDGSAWVLRRLGKHALANRREADADRAFHQLCGVPEPGKSWDY